MVFDILQSILQMVETREINVAVLAAARQGETNPMIGAPSRGGTVIRGCGRA